MNKTLYITNILVPLLAGCFISCEQQAAKQNVDYENVITQTTDSLRIISSDNGKQQYIFTTPLMERYTLSKEPYMEFRKGIKIETFNDSTGVRESSLVADYAIFLENQKLWQAKGNVVGVNKDGQTLQTQQLFWNQNTKRIYSNVDTRVTRPDGEVITGVGFESDESMTDWVFRRVVGKVLLDTDPTDDTDTLQVAPKAAPSAAPAPAPVQSQPAPAKPTPVATPPPAPPAPAVPGAFGARHIVHSDSMRYQGMRGFIRRQAAAAAAFNHRDSTLRK